MASVEVDRNGLEVLSRAECLRLLGTARLGRIGTTSGALPTVLPVNFWFDPVNEQVVIRTGPGSKLDAAVRNAVVAFEVDDVDPIEHSGWSVLVTGVAREVIYAREIEALRFARVARWAPRGDGRVMVISTELVTGRRIMPGLPEVVP